MLDLFQTGAYCRSAGGNLERPDLQKPVVKWMAWSINPDNGGNGNPNVWDLCRSLWAVNGIQSFPWLHCRSLADVDRLIFTGQDKGSLAIGLNIEDIAGDKISLDAVAKKLEGWGLPVHMATLPWVQNGQGWGVLGGEVIAALEIFKGPTFPVTPDPVTVKQCVDHAHAEGLPAVTLMLDTKQFTPAQYGPNMAVCHSLYTADDITPTAEAWNEWKAPPCVRQGENMLTPTQKRQFREEIADYCALAESYEQRWHYSMTRPYSGLGVAPQTFHTGDCSSYCALIFYWAAKHTAAKVSDPLDYNYSGYGNTQSAIDYLDAHKAPLDKYRIGDMAIYGTRSNTKHMTVCRKAGTGATSVWSSFGQEAGPLATKLHYRSDLVGAYRHPALL